MSLQLWIRFVLSYYQRLTNGRNFLPKDQVKVASYFVVKNLRNLWMNVVELFTNIQWSARSINIELNVGLLQYHL